MVEKKKKLTGSELRKKKKERAARRYVSAAFQPEHSDILLTLITESVERRSSPTRTSSKRSRGQKLLFWLLLCNASYRCYERMNSFRFRSILRAFWRFVFCICVLQISMPRVHDNEAKVIPYTETPDAD